MFLQKPPSGNNRHREEMKLHVRLFSVKDFNNRLVLLGHHNCRVFWGHQSEQIPKNYKLGHFCFERLI